LDIVATLLELPGRNAHAQAESLMAQFSLKKLLLTQGAEGAWLLNDDDSQAAIVGAPAGGIVDTVGAGDAFAAVFILGLLRGWPDPFLLERADEFARAVCGIRGAVPASAEFFAPFLQEWKIL
jgi:fructokinase